jgi:hypothetical protein
VEKSSPRICAASAIFNKMAKENNRPISENSPNLVALIVQFPEARCQGDQIG